MLRTFWSASAPRAAALVRPKRAPFTCGPLRRTCDPSLPWDIKRAVAGHLARQNQRRDMCSASVSARTSDGDAAQETGGSGRDNRDPETGEGMWVENEEEPLILERPKKVQKFCGKVVSDKMDKSIRVAVPYWYHVKRLGRKTIRYSNIMAHDEENSCKIGDKVVIVDCKRKSKRKAHILHEIVHKLPRLDDEM